MIMRNIETDIIHREAINLVLLSDVMSNEFYEDLKNIINESRDTINKAELDWILKDVEIFGNLFLNI